MIPLRHSFMGGDYWGERLRQGLGQSTFSNRDAAKVLKAAVETQYSMRHRNDALPAAYQLDQEKDILPVDQAISDQGNFIQQYDDDKGSGWFWDQPATISQRNAALTVQALVKALDARERDQEKKVGIAIANPPQNAPQGPQTPQGTPSKSSAASGAIVAVLAVAAFATAYFLSTEDWGGLPWSKKSPYLSPPEAS